VLSQSNAIIFYAADRAPGRLMPDQDLAGRALVLERFFYFLTDIIAPSHAAFQLRVHGVNEGPEILDHQVMSRLRHAERFIAQTPFMAGDAFSIADIAAFTIAAPLGEHLQWRGLPNLERWFKSIQTRESVIRGYAAFGSW
jgi:GST-like protein